jgi:transposase-like protein
LSPLIDSSAAADIWHEKNAVCPSFSAVIPNEDPSTLSITEERHIDRCRRNDPKKPGWYRCAERECRKDFTVTTGTVMVRSKIPLNKWLMAFYMLNSSKKGVSSHQLHRALGLDYKSAWFMMHRIREAMRDGGSAPLGGEGAIVEADETYYVAPRKRTTSRSVTRPTRKAAGKTKARPAYRGAR